MSRRIPLMVDVSFYSVISFCAHSPNYRAGDLKLLYGIGMGGEWGWVPLPIGRFQPSGVASFELAGGLRVRLSAGQCGAGGDRL